MRKSGSKKGGKEELSGGKRNCLLDRLEFLMCGRCVRRILGGEGKGRGEKGRDWKKGGKGKGRIGRGREGKGKKGQTRKGRAAFQSFQHGLGSSIYKLIEGDEK